MTRWNVVLTGIPRSGTTLACYLLNQLPDTVALHEPMEPQALAALGSRDRACAEIRRFFEETRRSLRAEGSAVSKHIGGRVPDNPIADRAGGSGLRESLVSKAAIRIDKELSEGFLLVVKHPSMFTAMLDRLVQRFPAYAVIRNPLAVLASWNSVALAVQAGHAPAAEAFDDALARTLGTLTDRIERQLCLLSWFFERYSRVLSPGCVVRYEELVASGGKALAVITPAAQGLSDTLEERNLNRLYDRRTMLTLAERLLRAPGAYWEFYSRESVERLARELAPAQ